MAGGFLLRGRGERCLALGVDCGGGRNLHILNTFCAPRSGNLLERVLSFDVWTVEE